VAVLILPNSATTSSSALASVPVRPVVPAVPVAVLAFVASSGVGSIPDHSDATPDDLSDAARVNVQVVPSVPSAIL